MSAGWEGEERGSGDLGVELDNGYIVYGRHGSGVVAFLDFRHSLLCMCHCKFGIRCGAGLGGV